MLQEEKELLLKDLCARLSYGVIVAYKSRESEGRISLGYGNIGYVAELGRGWWIDCKPYLRPMSSMTEEEKQMMDNLWEDNNKLVFTDPHEVRRYRFYDISVVDFLNSRHFDYRGLIEKGLALEAPAGMYNI